MRSFFLVCLACLSFVLFVACKEYTPTPLSPIQSESGKRQCMSSADCASGSCGSDGRCR